MPIINSIKNNIKDEYDVCIIGTGPAGLTLCKELSDSGKKICVIECGEMIKKIQYDELREVENKGEIKIKNSSRERIFGGTSTTWSGLSAPLDKIDLQDWPIDIKELEIYYRKASRYGFPEFPEFDHSAMDKIRKEADFTFESMNLNEKIFIAKDPPWDFGKQLKYIFDYPNIDLYTNITVTHISSIKDQQEKTIIKNVIACNIDGDEYKISSKIFILAVGGIESVRLLLLSKDTCPAGLGNENDQVGRYIMNHPKNNYGIIRLNKPVRNLNYLFGYLHSGWARYVGIRMNENIQQHLGLLNCYVRLEPIFPWTDSIGVSEFIILIKKLKLFLSWWKRQQKKIVNLRDWNETGDDIYEKDIFRWASAITHILKDMRAVSLYIINRLFNNQRLTIKKIRLRNFMDMEPRSDNRIILGKKIDRNGKVLPEIILNTSERDRDSLIELHRIIGKEIRDRNIGILESDLSDTKPWPIITEASHHLGGTRMGDDESNSVVNKDLKVHSTENLYICSGSVFPTSGCANPTYTICALSIRLAEQIKKI